MENRAVVKKSVLYILAWIAVLSLLMQGIFAIIGRWNPTVLFGNLLSGAAAGLNFAWYAAALAKAAEEEDERDRKQRIRLSFIGRRMMYIVVVAVGLLLPKVFSPITVILPLFFPPIAQFCFPLFKGMRD